MKSSSESIGLVLSVVSGVGGETAEAILLLDLVVVVGSIASAAFLFLSWEEMVSTVEGRRICQEGRKDTRLAAENLGGTGDSG